MKPPPLPPSIDEVLARLRASFAAHCPLTFGIHVKGTLLYWRDSITSETERIATLPLEPELLASAMAAVVDELRVLAASPADRAEAEARFVRESGGARVLETRRIEARPERKRPGREEKRAYEQSRRTGVPGSAYARRARAAGR